MDAPRDPRSSTGTRNFRLFWSAQSSSLVGMQVGMVAVPLLAIDVLGADAAQVALIGTLTALPWLIAPVIGAVVHRVDRPRLLTVSHFARALLWLTIPVALLGILTMPQLWLVAGATAVLGVAFAVGYRSLLPSIVDKDALGQANGRLAGTDAVARATGPALAGVLVPILGPVVTTALQSLTGTVAGALSSAIRVPRPAPTQAVVEDSTAPTVRPTVSWWRGVVAGFAHLGRLRTLKWLTVIEAGFIMCFTLCFAVIVVFFRIDLGLGAAAIGVIFSAGSLGGILGAVVANRLRDRLGFDLTVRGAAVLRGVGLAVLPLALFVPEPAVLVVLVAGRGLNACAWSVYDVLYDTYQQQVLSDAHRASATAAALWLTQGAAMVGAAAAAVLANLVGVPILMMAAAAGAVVAGLSTIAVRDGGGG